MRTRLLAGLLLCLLLAAAPTAWAATPDAVSIDVALTLRGNLQASTTNGTFTSSGAIADAGSESGSGWFAGLGHLKTGDPNSLHSSIHLVGAQGTITIDLVGLFGRLPAPLASGDGRWLITDATGAYAGMQGRGSWTATADFRAAMAGMGPPRVTFALDGTAN
jgi:hypothetical protein